MAAASTTLSSAIAPAAATISGSSSRVQRKMSRVVYMTGMNSYGGLKANNPVLGLGQAVCTEQCFANVVSAMKGRSSGGVGGGALSTTCNAAAEIFKIAAIMNGLTLVGVAVGFVLLRIEATVEEAE